MHGKSNVGRTRGPGRRGLFVLVLVRAQDRMTVRQKGEIYMRGMESRNA